MIVKNRTSQIGLFFAAVAIAGCSGGASNDVEQRHDQSSLPALVGEQMFACANDVEVDADFLADGLTLELTMLPQGAPERLSAPATGLAYVGHNVTATISGGEALTITRTGHSPLTCRRMRGSDQAP